MKKILKCEECGKITNDLIIGACRECAEKIIEKNEKNIKTKKMGTENGL